MPAGSPAGGSAPAYARHERVGHRSADSGNATSSPRGESTRPCRRWKAKGGPGMYLTHRSESRGTANDLRASHLPGHRPDRHDHGQSPRQAECAQRCVDARARSRDRRGGRTERRGRRAPHGCRARVRRRRGHRGAGGSIGRRGKGARRAWAAHLPQIRAVAKAYPRRDQRLRARRRLRARYGLPSAHRVGRGQVRTARGEARHDAGLRRDAAPAATRRQGPRAPAPPHGGDDRRGGGVPHRPRESRRCRGGADRRGSGDAHDHPRHGTARRGALHRSGRPRSRPAARRRDRAGGLVLRPALGVGRQGRRDARLSREASGEVHRTVRHRDPSAVRDAARVVLTTLALRDFRNLARLDLQFPDAGAVVIGENGQGKTNLLEAIYYLHLLRSVRGARDVDIVRFGAAGFHIAARTGGGKYHELSAGFERQGRRKRVKVDGAEPARLSDALGALPCVLFSPADVDLVAGAPSSRRRYLDILLALSSRPYLAALQRYRAALAQRNAALRDALRNTGARAEQRVAVWEAPLAEHGAVLWRERVRWTERAAERFAELCAAIGEQAPVEMRYATA